MDRRGNGVLDEVDVAVILFRSNLEEDGVRIDELRACLVEEPGDGFHARQHIAHAHVLGRVVVGERLEQSASDQFHIHGGVVPVALDAVQLEQLEPDLVVDETPVGGVFRLKRSEGRLLVEVLAPGDIGAALFRHAGRTYVIEQGIERDLFSGLGVHVKVVTDLRCHCRRHGKCLVDEVFAHAGKLCGRCGLTVKGT